MNLNLNSKTPHEIEYKMVGFAVGDVRYGIDIMQIREIMNPAEFVNMPAMPPYVLGVADHREMVVPIIDLRTRFGLESAELTRRSKWVVIRLGDRDIGLQVDYVTQVLKVTPEHHRDRRAILNDGNEIWIKDVYSDEQGLVFELDLETVVTCQVSSADLDNKNREKEIS